MDQHTFVFATRGHCKKGKQCQRITIKNQNMSLCSKQSSLFSFYALPSGSKSKGKVVHYTIASSNVGKLHGQQCDQIWRNFAAWGKFKKVLAIS